MSAAISALSLGGQVPAVEVGGKRVMAVAGPFHRAPDPALDANGRFFALRATNTSNLGASAISFVPLAKGIAISSSVYDIACSYMRGRAVVTNTAPTSAIGKREHCDRRLVGQGKCWSAFSRRHLRCILSGGETHPVDTHGSSNVFEALFTQIIKCEVEPTHSILLNTGRNADPARFSQSFEPSGDVHAVSENVVVLHNDVADVDTYSELDAAGRRRGGITLGHDFLNLSRTTQCINHTGKFDQQAITGRFDDAAPVFGNLRID
jgi:hypothetical protein